MSPCITRRFYRHYRHRLRSPTAKNRSGRRTKGCSRSVNSEAGEYFASHGIAALIYDKRGTGESGGAYESHRPYENLVKDALSAVVFLKQRREIAESHIGIWGLSQGAYISATAAARTEDIAFILSMHATNDCDGMGTERSRQHIGFSSSSFFLSTRSSLYGGGRFD